MLVELGHFALILSLLVALTQGVLPLAGVFKSNALWQSTARPLALLQWSLVALAFVTLEVAFLQSDFSVVYVTEHSNSLLPWPYKMAALWGGHEGSLLLWVFLLGVWSSAVALFSKTLAQDMVARVLSVMGLISSGFLLFILTTSNPFLRALPAASEGQDLNPLLQDPGLVIHPPMLYMGYVGMSVAFAFAIAALMAGRLDTVWARWSRPWTLVAWTFLTFGIGLGSWWAYYELGWGGWWFWDPVENASLMPWLVATALIHSLMVTEKRGSFKAWTVLLAIAAFSLSLLGTFLVRSGVLTSVHAFASDPARGIFILIFLALVVGSSLTLFAWRAPTVSLGSPMGLLSKESFLLANSVLLSTATLAVLLGTLYPLIIDALNLGKLSVGPPYFNVVFAPLMVPVLFMMVPGALARWRQAQWSQIKPFLVLPFFAATIFSLGLSLWMGHQDAGILLGFWLGAWVAFASFQQIAWRAKQGQRMGGSFLGMQLAHLGLAVVVLGITGVKNFEIERDVRMGVGDQVTLSEYHFKLVGVKEIGDPITRPSERRSMCPKELHRR